MVILNYYFRAKQSISYLPSLPLTYHVISLLIDAQQDLCELSKLLNKDLEHCISAIPPRDKRG